MGYLTHLTILEHTIRKYPSNVAYKVPSEDGLGWKNVTYKKFWDDISLLAARWLDILEDKARPGEIIGLWTAGKTYVDFIQMFGLQRAGYTPHLVSTFLDDNDLVRNLFDQSGAKVIIADLAEAKQWQKLVGQFQIIPVLDLDGPTSVNVLSALGRLPPMDGDGDDIMAVDQSSGSTSGKGKVVRITRRWIDANARKWENIKSDRVEVSIRNGSLCYAPQLLHLLRTFIYADCTVLTTGIKWEADELANIISECGVTNIFLYPTLINDIIQQAKGSPNLTEKLRSLDTFSYGGGPLDKRSIEWAIENRIPIVSRFGSTEVGTLMSSRPGTPHLLKFVRKWDYEFVPVPGDEPDSKVRELVILPTSPDCPQPEVRNPKDGKYYTSDLFERVEGDEFGSDEVYVSRGRRDDIIIMEDASNCDAKYLENKVGYLCHDLISTFVVVGQGRPSPALLVEPLDESQDNSDGHSFLHKRLVLRLATLISCKGDSKLYPHEEIKPEYIIVVPKGSLPISSVKGTVIRSKTETKFMELLDKAYAGDSVWNGACQ